MRFAGFRTGKVDLLLIDSDRVRWLATELKKHGESEIMLGELRRSYQDDLEEEVRETFGFQVNYAGDLAGMCLLRVSDWDELRGYTGADTLPHMRGKGIAPACKPALYYLGFELLKLNRIETGCFVSNESSRRSIEKTPGVEFEGILRQWRRNSLGIIEDERRYSILRSDWERLYAGIQVEVIPEPTSTPRRQPS